MADLFMTPGGAGLMDGTTPENGFDWAAFDAWATGAAAAGDNLYVGPGNYVGTANVVSALDGTALLPINIIGVSSLTTLAEATGTDRPLWAINAGIYAQFNDYWNIRNLRMTGNAGNHLLRFDKGGRAGNLDVDQAGAGNAIQNFGTGSIVEGCRARSVGGTGIRLSSESFASECVVYGSLAGVNVSGSSGRVLDNLVFDCATAIDIDNISRSTIFRNTLYNGTTGILKVAVGLRSYFLENIIAGFTTGANWTGGPDTTDFWDWNVWHNNTTDVVNVTKGPNAINADPQFVDPSLGTVEGFRTRAEVVRNLGLTIFPAGAVAPSIYEGGETNIVGDTDPDFSSDQLLRESLEVVELDGVEVQYVNRMPEDEIEQEPTEGVYVSRHTEFRLPCGDFYPVGLDRPHVGSAIVDDVAHGSNAYVIESVRHPVHSDFWGCIARAAVIAGTFDLDDTATLWKATFTKDPGLGKDTTHTEDATFSGVAAKFMLRSSEAGSYGGQAQIVERYDVYVDTEIGQVDHADLLKDQDYETYRIVSYRNRLSFCEFSVIECEIRKVGP